jgi:hypothetical protein
MKEFNDLVESEMSANVTSVYSGKRSDGAVGKGLAAYRKWLEAEGGR